MFAVIIIFKLEDGYNSQHQIYAKCFQHSKNWPLFSLKKIQHTFHESMAKAFANYES